MKIRFSIAILSLSMFAAYPLPAQAESLDGLMKKGYKVSTLTKSKSGSPGWNLSKDGTTFFCRMKNMGTIKNGKNGLISFTSAGRTVSVDKKTYLNSLGWKEMPKGTPDYSDLKAGRINGRMASGCIKS